MSAGIGGSSPLQNWRGKGDRFGVGYANTATSTEFGATPQFSFAPCDSQVIEANYRYQWTPAIKVTPDIQWVQGMLGCLTDVSMVISNKKQLFFSQERSLRSQVPRIGGAAPPCNQFGKRSYDVAESIATAHDFTLEAVHSVVAIG